MAEEIKRTITIDVGDGIVSLKEYKKHIEELKGALLALDSDSEEYKTIASQIKKEQEKLNEVMKAGGNATDVASDSYYALNQQLIEAKKAWKQLSQAEREADSQCSNGTLATIQKLDKQLKELDSSIGQYQRNVGNYQNAFTAAFTNIKDSVVNAVPAVGKLNTAFKALIANPVGAVIAAIAVAVKAVASAMKNSEGQLQAFKVATSGIRVVTDGLKNALSAVAGAIVKVTQKAQELITKVLSKVRDAARGLGLNGVADSIQSVLDKMADYKQLAEDNNALTLKTRQVNEANAQSELKISELRAKASDKVKYSYAQRLKFTKQAADEELAISKRNKELAEFELKVLEKEALMTENDAEMNNKLSEARIKVAEATTSYNNKVRELNGQIGELTNKIASSNAALEKQAEDLGEAEKKAQELADALAEQQQKEQEWAAKSAAKEYKVSVTKLEDNSNQDKFMAELEIENEQAKAERIYAINRKLLEDKIALQQEYLDYFLGDLEEQFSLEKELSDNKRALANLDLEHKKELSDREVKLAQETAKNKKIAEQSIVNVATSVLDMLSNMSEEDAEKQKALQIASTTIKTIAGAAGAFQQGMASAPPPYGAIIGGAAAAVATASGVAEIAKIKSTSATSDSGSVGAIVTPRIEDYTPEYTQNVTGQSDITNLQDALGTQKVILVESDVEEALSKSNSRRVETTW